MDQVSSLKVKSITFHPPKKCPLVAGDTSRRCVNREGHLGLDLGQKHWVFSRAPLEGAIVGLGCHTGKCGLADTGVKEGPLDFGALTISPTESPLSHMERQKLTQRSANCTLPGGDSISGQAWLSL